MTKSTPERVNILNEAADLIVGQRQEDYGTPEENFQRMADFANIHFRKNLEQNIPISPQQAAEYMILLKMARLTNSPTRDTYVDIAGYAGIAGELATPIQPTLPHEDLAVVDSSVVESTESANSIVVNVGTAIDPVMVGQLAFDAVEKYLTSGGKA